MLSFNCRTLIIFKIFRIDPKGNGSCDLSFIHIRETADLQPIGTIRGPDFDLYIKKVDCKLNIPRDPPESPNYHPESHHKPDYLFGQDHRPDNRPNSYPVDEKPGHGPLDHFPKPLDPYRPNVDRYPTRPIEKPIDIFESPPERPDLDPYPSRPHGSNHQMDLYSPIHQDGPSRIPPPPSYESYAPNYLGPPPKRPHDRPFNGPSFRPEYEGFFKPNKIRDEDFLKPSSSHYPYRPYGFMDHFMEDFRGGPRPSYHDR